MSVMHAPYGPACPPSMSVRVRNPDWLRVWVRVWGYGWGATFVVAKAKVGIQIEWSNWLYVPAYRAWAIEEMA